MKRKFHPKTPPPSVSCSPNNPGDFGTLYTHYVDRVYQKCLTMTKNPEVAEDFTQDIFLKAFTKLNTFQNRSSLATWLYSVTHNYCLDQLRSNKRLNTELLSDHLLDKATETEQSAEDQFLLMERIVNDLPTHEANMLRLKYEQGLTIKVIGEQFDLSESTVKMRLSRTRRKLQIQYARLYHH